MDEVLTVTIPGVFENLKVLGNIDGKQSLYRQRLVDMGAANNSDAVVNGSLYYLSENGKLTVRDDVAHEPKVLDFCTEISRADGLWAMPVFFETRYVFRAKCAECVKNVSIYHRLRSVTDGFSFADGWLFGDIDFINTPGRFTLSLDVEFKDGSRRRVSLKFTVVSVKMDVEGDYKKILSKIDGERRGLVQNFLSKTFGDAGFDSQGTATKPSWYAILEKIFDFYVAACKKIILDPHRRYEGVAERRRADLIKRWSPALANRYATLSDDRREHTLFRVERIEAKVDTQENRFVLHTLRGISRKLREFSASYKSVKGISDVCIAGIDGQASELERLASNPFFRGVAQYTGGGARSLVLQKRPGYAQILSAWITLKRALSPEGKGLDVGYRPLSSLYEFWCFLSVRDMIRSLLPEKDGWVVVEDPRIASLENLLDSDAEADARGEYTLCRMGYKFRNGGRTVILAYQQTYGTMEDGETFANVYEQRPDIVLSIRDNKDGHEDVYTYLFDAKYRVDELDGKDASPRDAIDDMHRYRDAILYRRQKAGYSHEIIGAYVLFPGRTGGYTYDYEKMREKENIGAFPLLPGWSSPVKGFLEKILDGGKAKKDHLKGAMPPRGAEISLDPVIEDEMIYTLDLTERPNYWNRISRDCWNSVEKCFYVPVPARDDRKPDEIKRIVLLEGNAPQHILDNVVFKGEVQSSSDIVAKAGFNTENQQFWLFAVQGNMATKWD